MAVARVNDLDQELFSELTEPLVQPLLIHVVPPFADGKDPNYCLQINGNVLWEWRTLEGNLKKLCAVLQRKQTFARVCRDTQRLFSVNYLFGEANIVYNLLLLENG